MTKIKSLLPTNINHVTCNLKTFVEPWGSPWQLSFWRNVTFTASELSLMLLFSPEKLNIRIFASVTHEPNLTNDKNFAGFVCNMAYSMHI